MQNSYGSLAKNGNVLAHNACENADNVTPCFNDIIIFKQRSLKSMFMIDINPFFSGNP